MTRQEALMHLLTEEANCVSGHSAAHSLVLDKSLPIEWAQAKTNMSQGSYEMAYNQLHHLRPLYQQSDQLPALQEDLYRCIEGMANIFLVESIEALRGDIVNYRKLPDADNDKINHLCIQLIHFRYNSEGENYSLQDLAEDAFLMDCFANDFYPDPHIEQFLTDIRRKLLLGSVREMEINSSSLPLFQAIAIQGYLTNYVFFSHDDEEKIVESLNTELGSVLSADQCDLGEITSTLLLIAMYKPLYQSNANPALDGLQNSQLPEYLQTIFILTYQEPSDIYQKAEQVLTLGEINAQSDPVRQQYEEAPYPRYSRLNFWPEKQAYRHRSKKLYFSDSDLSVLDRKPLEILVAGSGTGNQPLRLANSILDSNITAVDLSRQSLAFAERMRTAYSINNVQFFQADILELPKVFNSRRQRFDVIECVGVLHHMKDLHVGLAALNELLVPGGVMHLALYSASARSRISELRKLQSKLGIQATASHIRHFRKTLFKGDIDEKLRQILYARDFYNLNGCRDLLFNTQETCLSIPQIKELIDSQGLEFLGFHFDDGDAEQRYAAHFPSDSDQRNLDYWHQIEQLYPDTFWCMYQFYCKKRG